MLNSPNSKWEERSSEGSLLWSPQYEIFAQHPIVTNVLYTLLISSTVFVEVHVPISSQHLGPAAQCKHNLLKPVWICQFSNSLRHRMRALILTAGCLLARCTLWRLAEVTHLFGGPLVDPFSSYRHWWCCIAHRCHPLHISSYSSCLIFPSDASLNSAPSTPSFSFVLVEFLVRPPRKHWSWSSP